MNKKLKKKLFHGFALTSVFTLFFFSSIAPVKTVYADSNDDNQYEIERANDKFDFLSDFLQDNNYSTEGMSKQELFNLATDINNGDATPLSETKEGKNMEPDTGVQLMNNIFGNDDLIFFKTDTGYNYIAKPDEDDSTIKSMATDFLASTVAGTMFQIMHPMDYAVQSSKNAIRDTIHPIDAMERSLSHDEPQTYLDKFDMDKYESKYFEQMRDSSIAPDNMIGTMDSEMQKDVMEERLNYALDGLFEQLYNVDNEMEHTMNDSYEQLTQQQELSDTLNQLNDQNNQMIFDASMTNNIDNMLK